MFLNNRALLAILCLSTAAFSQEKTQDSLKVTQLDQVVITGQFEPQSVKKSVFNVRVITDKDIKNLAANNLADVLNQYLNITATPSGRDGRSTVSLFGLDGQYFKIFVDNVPLVNNGGLGNNTDLSQINLNDIMQIEIVEGSMGVTHGANAVSGILNIITKKSSQYKWSVSATAQEETVGKEFEFFDKGRHIQALKVTHTLNENWFVSAGANRNDFQGFYDGRKGKNYAENDDLRGYRWLPKEQWHATGLLSYSKNNFRVFYKFEFLDELIEFYQNTVQSGYSPELGPYRYGDDIRYFTDRYFHNLGASGKIFSRLNFNVSLSHQKQQRDVEEFDYNINFRQESNNKRSKDQSMEVVYSTGTLSNFFADKKADLQLGYEIVSNKGYSIVQEATGTAVETEKTLSNYDFFVSSEINPTKRFSIRPGLRYSIQTQFKEQYASSLGLRYLFDSGLELRGSYGTSFRTPTFEELYYYFVNNSHSYIGNENLIPETSTSYEISLKKNTAYASANQLSNTLAVNYLNVNDRIDMARIGTASNGVPEFQYINISKYRMWNFSSTNQLKVDNLNFTLGAALIGISQRNDNQLFTSDERFLYTFNVNSSISYLIPKWATTFSVYYKYNGKTQQFVTGNTQYLLATLGDSHWLDASVRKQFFGERLEATIGVRNLMDITNVNLSQAAEGTAHATSSNQMLAYGRSYFVKLMYNLNF